VASRTITPVPFWTMLLVAGVGLELTLVLESLSVLAKPRREGLVCAFWAQTV
jgi:hypothetical protein